MKKANAKLAEAQRYVASYKPKSVLIPKPAPAVEPVKAETEIKPNRIKVENAEIKKLQKGYFFIIVTCCGQQREIQKRFKSTTKAQEWIYKHEYLTL